MRFEVECEGRRRLVELERRQDGWSALIDGRRCHVALDRVASRLSVLLAPDAEAPVSRSHEVVLERLGSGWYRARVDGRALTVSVADPRRRIRASARRNETSGPERVVSPMPGRIVKLLVSSGDIVAPGQGLVVVEAMKMENELRTARGGTVADIAVREGELVEAGTVLVVVSPR